MEKVKHSLAAHVLLDRSGSMEEGLRIPNARNATNQYIEQLATAILPTTISVTQFNAQVSEMIVEQPCHTSPKVGMDYKACGGTSTDRAVNFAIAKLKAIDAEQKAVIVVTDGQDVINPNTQAEVKALIKAGWLFIIVSIGVLPDHLAQCMGVARSHTVHAKTAAKIEEAMAKVAQATLEFKAGLFKGF